MLTHFISVTLCPAAKVFQAWSVETPVTRRDESVRNWVTGQATGGENAPERVGRQVQKRDVFL